MRPLIIIVLVCLMSCMSKYPAEKYAIPKKYRDLITSYQVGDTLKFSNNTGDLSLYLITAIDSSFVDEGQGIINVRGVKDIGVSCRELTNTRKGYEEYTMILLNKYPDEDSATFDVRIKDFYSRDTSQPFVLKRDTIVANNLSFSNYYSFRPYYYYDLKDPNAVSEIYITKEKGIIAYKNVNGIWWTRVNGTNN